MKMEIDDAARPLTALLLAAGLAAPSPASPAGTHAHDDHARDEAPSVHLEVPRPHDEATLEAEARAVEAGDSLSLTGTNYAPGESYLLRLEGALRSYELGEVEPDTAGRVAHRLRIPAQVREGRYQLAAVAPDGDVVARLDLTVLAAAGGDGGGGAVEGQGGGDPAAGSREARPDDIAVQRSRSGAEWGVIGLFVGLAGSLGVGLLRKG